MRHYVITLLLSIVLLAYTPPTKNITGNIKDEKGTPVAGASILIKGTQTGTSSDAGGNFVLKVPIERNRIVVSAIGYETQELSIAKDSVLHIVLKASKQNLEEVVVVGYSRVFKKILQVLLPI